MKTPYLDDAIEYLELAKKRKGRIASNKQLQEYKAIKQALLSREEVEIILEAFSEGNDALKSNYSTTLEKEVIGFKEVLEKLKKML